MGDRSWRMQLPVRAPRDVVAVEMRLMIVLVGLRLSSRLTSELMTLDIS